MIRVRNLIGTFFITLLISLSVFGGIAPANAAG